ncbi:hypothetical protein NCS52_00272800 [Fusarium sp. LHS14.1]|nr:hypothetical protein NCS52_00272800 [Fusarium sp. LHS14.1]
MDQCQTADEHRLTKPTGDESHTVPNLSELMQETWASSGETLPIASPLDQIQPPVELEPFILPAKSTASLPSAAYVPPSPPQTLIPGKSRSLFRVWALEVASLLLSFSCFILIIVVLAHFDQRGLPDWPLSITLNSFLAFFSTLIRATFMLPVSTAISQMKWSWFLQDRPLYDFHVLDQASRGLRGSFMLLWRARCKSFISLAAVIIITSTLASPVTQLAINYPMRDQEVPRGAYTRVIQKIQTPSDFLYPATNKAIQLATALDTSYFNNPMPPLGAFCSTSNCTFDKYHTLGVCVKLANISSHLKVESFKDLESEDLLPPDREYLKKTLMLPRGIRVWKASLSEQLYLLHFNSFSLFTDILNGSDTFRFRNEMNLLRTRIASFVLLFTTPIYNDTVSTGADIQLGNGSVKVSDSFWQEAWEVLFYLCVQSYHTKVQMGEDETRMVSSIAIPMEPEDNAFLDTKCPQILTLWTEVLFHPQKLLNHTARYNGLNNIYLNVATALSSVIRRADLRYTEHGFNVTGKAWTSEAYVQIQWGWLSFLVFELVLAASLLALTIATQKGSQDADRESYDMVCDLKDSSLATLVALDNDCRSMMGDGLVPVKELEKAAKEVHVRLRGNKLVTVDVTHDIRGDSP